jgi:hypothetical protein
MTDELPFVRALALANIFYDVLPFQNCNQDDFDRMDRDLGYL